MIEVAELIIAFIGALATVIGVVHTIRRDKRNDHKKLPFTGHGIIDRGCRELAHRQPLSIIP